MISFKCNKISLLRNNFGNQTKVKGEKVFWKRVPYDK